MDLILKYYKKYINMLEIFNLLAKYELSPNQYYMLISMKEGISCPQINEAQELRALISKDFIYTGEKDLTQKSFDIIAEVEGMVKLASKKVTKAVLGPEASDSIDKYREMWNMGKLPSGVPARVNKKELETKFQKFFQKYTYSWEEILAATAYYIDQFERNSPPYLYMKNSSYFISKMTQDKSQESTLANYIELMRSGDDELKAKTFSEKVV